jgi:OOP family OmpA-OmpF porin
LVNKGIVDNKIATIGKGESEPIAPNDTKEGKDKNRRVVFALSVAN